MLFVEYEKDEDVKNFIAMALERRNLIPIIGAGFSKGANAKNGSVPDGRELSSSELSPKSRFWCEDPTSRCSSELSSNRKL